jgi:aminoglycoside phosphotransferase family enzyme/predicted kinase
MRTNGVPQGTVDRFRRGVPAATILAMDEVPGAPVDSAVVSPAVHETHTGIVVLVGDRAYKAKKPVVTDFLDFSTPQAREQVCQREVALNRRLAPTSYLGVAHLTGPQEGHAEPVIVMRRHPDSRCLATMIAAGLPVTGHLDRIAEVLAGFHRRAERGDVIDLSATPEAVAARWQENLTELHRYTADILPADTVAAVGQLATEFMSRRSALFARRIEQRRIVDGHGDLQSSDVFCLPEGPALLDCLEFDDQLRYVDGVDDAAFLAMDLEFLGHKDLGDHFLNQYCRLADDQAPPGLKHFYIAYRAVVRAKVDCICVRQGRSEARADARRHLAIALEHLSAGAVRLIIIGGGPGTGKSTLAQSLAREIGADVVSTDDVRRDLQRSGRIGGTAGTLHAGLYDPANVDTVYTDVLRRAQEFLAGGHTVILDGTWRDRRHRTLAHEVAAECSAPVLEFVCTTTLDDAKARIATRGETASDATAEMAAPLTPDPEDWVGAHRVDTSRSLQENIAEAREVCCVAI